MAARYIENELRDYALAPAPRNKGKVKKNEDAAVQSALRLSLQRIVWETPPAEAAKSRDFSVYTGKSDWGRFEGEKRGREGGELGAGDKSCDTIRHL